MSSKPSQATTLVELALGITDIEFFHTDDHDAFVTVPNGTHRETWPLRGGQFRRWLARLCFEQAGIAVGAQALQDALATLEGTALFGGGAHDVHLRLADHDGAIYLDLGDDYWQAVRISRDGWEVVHNPPVRFRRPRGMRPLPYPAAGGSLDELRGLVNVSDDDWPLYVAWLVAGLRPSGPFTVLLVHGEQGSAKSTAVRVARAIIDPNEAPVRREPRDGRDLVVAASNGWVVAYDNVSYLPQWLSDDIARLATGIGFGARQLYTDMDEVIVNVSRPVVINGIEEVATRGDLLDRGLVLQLPTITTFRSEDEFWEAFTDAHPRILGALLDAAVCALRNVGEVEVGHLRMADFARWVVAAEPALGLRAGEFLAAYESNRAGAVQITLEASLLVEPLRIVAEQGFEGTASELLARMGGLVAEDVARKKAWPGGPHVLAGHLRRLAPALRRIGVEVEFSRDATARTITVRTGTKSSVTSVTSVTEAVAGCDANDGDDANDASSQPLSNGHRPRLGEHGYAQLLTAAHRNGHITESELRDRLTMRRSPGLEPGRARSRMSSR